jgi:hypothetical protein
MAQARNHQTNKGTTMKITEAPVVTICKSFVEAGKSFMSETELTKLIEQYALRDQRSGESPAQVFSRVVCGNTAEGLLFRKALAVCKAVQLQIIPVATAAGDTDVEDDSGEATAEMERLVNEQIRRSPEMTRSQAWNVVIREHPALAKRAIPVPAPTTSFPYPR